ncbi:MAG: FAD-dependent oxidoreductase [Chloroflexota bacterium]|nr:MAG: FAD-dependent oxidoreductase [Chloroflexota bacterium]
MIIPKEDLQIYNSSNGNPVGAVMVVGGGIAGMQASLDLADAGFKVYLVEKEPAIGGHMAALDKTFPTNDCAMCTISPRLVTTAGHNNIEVLTNTELLKLDGEPGRFTATVQRNPRYIDISKCTACGDCAEVCPIVIEDRFNGSLNKRKAAFKLYPQAVPNAFAIEKKGIAPCRDACPAGQRAQGYIALIREGRYDDALRVIKEDNPFPGICGRICNHRCETACNRNLVDEPISIAGLKRFVTDQVYNKPYQPPQPAKRIYKERIAIIGSGPCGLTAAKDLVLAGYGITVFESLPVAGGMLRVGVPEYRLPTVIVNREVQEIIDLGIELRLNTRVENLDDLFEEGFDAVLIAVGAHKGKNLPIPGADHPANLTAVDFLRDVCLGNGPDLKGHHVLVLGGGNVALDAARTAVRLGAKQVDIACLESREAMLADEHEIFEAEEEGIRLFPGRAFNQVIHTNGLVSGVEAVDVKYMKFEIDGSLSLETEPNSEHVITGDKVIFAIGQAAGLAFIPEDSQVGVTRRGTVAVNPNTFSTSRQGVFAAGDATTGTAFVIEAVAAGHQAAENIKKYLRSQELEIREQPNLPVVKMNPTEVSLRLAKGEIKRTPRVPMTALEITHRRQTFDEVNLGYTKEEAHAEAARCLQCGICSECLSCYYKCAAGAINHDEIASFEQIDVGAVILASGFEPYDARLSGEYGLGRYPNVVSSMQFERVLSPSGPYTGHLLRPSDGHEPKRIAWIQCVGSRQAGRNWCSAVCCMYATKQALIAQEHAPGTECTIFYIDFRAYGKGFDAYYERAKEEGVRYIRALPSSIRENPSTENLLAEYVLPNGSQIQEEFDLVVLSVGMQPPHSMSKLAGDLGVALTEDGFCQTTNLSPLDTTRKGVYVCGPITEPKDIPETVMSASAAAARAMTLLAEGRHTLIQAKEYPPEIDVSGQEPRVGVFVCHCGTNIAGVVDVKEVTQYARTLPNVVFADNNLFTCSTDSQNRIQQAIQEHNLNRVVVASCTPRTHEPIFQDTIRQVGLNFYLFELANIRDQCSWVHRDFPAAATDKAKDLVRMAVAKVRLVEALERKSLEFNHDALVIGGGLAGITAALELADQGFKVSLVERQPHLGGNMRHLHFLLSHANPQALLEELVKKTKQHPNITTFLEAELASFDGSLGNFKSTLKIAGSNETPQINHGVVIVATGAQPYQPSEYLYGQDERILTQLELEDLLTTDPTTVAELKSIVMIQCVGSRTKERPYCSRICCGQAIKNALEIKKVNPDCEVFILYQDIRTYGLLEKYYRQARKEGILFLRYEPNQPPQVLADGNLQVVVHDGMLETDIALQADRLVLSVATSPHGDAHQLAQLLKVPQQQDGFFQEAHMKLAPIDFASDGIFLCGMAHYPKKAVTESVIQAKAAAGRAATILAQQNLEIEPITSHVRKDKCDGCAYCVDPCPFDAISLVEYQDENGQLKKRVEVDETLCKGCGTCQATCPKDAIYISHFKLDYLRAMTMAALEV